MGGHVHKLSRKNRVLSFGLTMVNEHSLADSTVLLVNCCTFWMGEDLAACGTVYTSSESALVMSGGGRFERGARIIYPQLAVQRYGAHPHIGVLRTIKVARSTNIPTEVFIKLYSRNLSLSGFVSKRGMCGRRRVCVCVCILFCVRGSVIHISLRKGRTKK